jgi:hypothetical protein
MPIPGEFTNTDAAITSTRRNTDSVAGELAEPRAEACSAETRHRRHVRGGRLPIGRHGDCGRDAQLATNSAKAGPSARAQAPVLSDQREHGRQHRLAGVGKVADHLAEGSLGSL